MLVLSRQKDEVIEIDGGRITVSVVDIRGDKVRLGVTAPRDVPVHRQEIADAIRRESGQQAPPPRLVTAAAEATRGPVVVAAAEGGAR